MSSFIRPLGIATPAARSVAVAALLGATMLASPLSAALAGPAANPASQLAQAAALPKRVAAAATQTRGESVEQRIKSLHAALKITPAEDAKWNDVAQAMRENAAAMDKVVAETRTTAPQGMTAVNDLEMYQKFAQTHVDGLKNLISSFTVLYDAMPDAQKKVADTVFNTFGHRASAANHKRG